MIVAVASGKGGTGKTTLAASLAVLWPRPLLAVDLDVEAPNLHLFLRPEGGTSEPVHLEVPQVDAARCTGCGACAELCQFKAISLLGPTAVVFPEMCHGCGGCRRVCPAGAISAGQRVLGVIESGLSRGRIPCLTGRLRIGEAMSPPLIGAVRRRMALEALSGSLDVLIDAPPGVSCPAVAAVQDADVILLVTEPTPFGLYDLKLAHQAFLPMGKPMALVVNRSGLGDQGVQAYAREQGLPILAEIPFKRELAEHYARGGVLADLGGAMEQLFRDLGASLEEMVAARREVARA